ncbi:hypothetical protein BO83DRAFT_148691 [Aspergillus eucalypticola CBS 122712]|uniref:Transmembrane protein n=1 Tax=Aspergillus eucalypticola (strain CBS 122712 / IBT 29274) TaxID=1448314 RepID=A0A317UTW0_ASPEC|nr:uncharacterized protein BO83DRAFT_148691 [Aspergillus eucalypticola CBS 122712]PWY63967.1 hypothetical protein BO83DRAFT_148691 [Aspergillus eucalypticola CBS 122712]
MGLGGRQGVNWRRTHTLPLENPKKKKRQKDLAKINLFFSLSFILSIFSFWLFFFPPSLALLLYT